MREKFQAKAFELVAPLLQPGERPITATRALAGSFTASRVGTAVTAGLKAQGLAGALLTSSTSKQFVVVTSERLIFLPQTFMGGPGAGVLGEIPRDQVTLAEAKIGVVSLVRIAFGNDGDGISLTFPRIDKKNAQALADALRPAPTA
ncbi:hypothetical protein M1L60_01145 [Actinoplanes sp. TRM 88003]|uniref:YokE-like PH domain-containing protein n=1 Tax=Paractinoplanes aksuensis TaxID=2939490 RepID=A0ABT1DEE5_9ACTN|nr:hypothetical protein [Actinoplanes aksuensis]MCO8269191.1 hypothetical protein [Actinoplanes aksuensis]